MEELLTTGYYPYLHLENPEILIKDSLVYSKPRSLKKKVRKTSDQISEMIARGLSREEIIDYSVELITAELRPSRFGYVCAVIASEFPKTFLRWVKINELADQVLDVVSACEPVFGLLQFNAHRAEHHSVYVTVTNFIRHYLRRKNKQASAKARAVLMQKKTAGLPVQSTGDEIIFPEPIPTGSDPLSIQPATSQKIWPAEKKVSYFESSLLENAADAAARPKSSYKRVTALAFSNPSQKTEIMANKQYLINKGINKSIVFKGLKAQYIGYMGLGLLLDLLFYAVLYLFKVNTYITLLLTASLGFIITAIIYHLNAQYGEHGLSKSLAKRKTPKIIRSFSRKIFR